jgi:hypothetical protein
MAKITTVLDSLAKNKTSLNAVGIGDNIVTLAESVKDNGWSSSETMLVISNLARVGRTRLRYAA